MPDGSLDIFLVYVHSPLHYQSKEGPPNKKNGALNLTGGAKYEGNNSKAYSTGTKCQINLKQLCKFELTWCQKVYLKKMNNLDHGGTVEGIIPPRIPKNQPHRVHVGL